MNKLIFLTVVFFTISSTASASFINSDPFSNGGPSGDDGIASDLALVPLNTGTPLGGVAITTGAGGFTVTTVQWFGHYTGNVLPAMDDFTIRFFTTDDDAGDGSITTTGFAGADPAYTGNTGLSIVDSGIDIGASDVYAYSVTLPSAVNLAPNESFVVSIYNNTTIANPWRWDESVIGGHGIYGALEVTSFQNLTTGDELALGFNGSSSTGPAVPEPSSFILLGTAIVGALAYRRRRKVA